MLLLSSKTGLVSAESLMPKQVQIALREIQVINKPINNGTVSFIIICDSREDISVLRIGRVAVGENITVSSPLMDVGSSEFHWKVVLVDGSEELMTLQGWSDFQNAQYRNPIVINETRLSVPSTGKSVVIWVTKVFGVIQFAAELQKTGYKNFTLQYWIDFDGNSKPQDSEVMTKNLSPNGTILLDTSSFRSLRLVTDFDVQLNISNRNVAWFSGKWDFRTDKALFSNSSLSPDLDVIKWAWFYPDPKSTVFEIALNNEDLFHKLKTGTTADSVSHGSGVLVGRPTELLNEVIARLQGKEEAASKSSTTSTTAPQPSPTSLDLFNLLTPLGLLIMIPAAIILLAIASIKLRRYIRSKRLIKTGEL